MKTFPQRVTRLHLAALGSGCLVNAPAIAQNADESATPPLHVKEDRRPPAGYVRPPLYIRTATTLAPKGITPSQLLKFYSIGANQGAGATIAIVDAYDNPNIAADLAHFSSTFGLPVPPTCSKTSSGNPILLNGCFAKVYASGSKPKGNQGWGLEMELDVQWAHVVAPAANIVLVEAASNSMTNLMAAVDKAVQLGASVVSMSWGGREFSGEASYDSHFNKSGITFVASSGDSGTGPDYPAISPYVVAVGGTTANMGSDGTYIGETAWSGSGGGLSLYEPKPAAQNPYLGGSMRGSPDVAYIADPNTGFPVYDSYGYYGQTGWFEVGGTSAGAPQWAALFAIANSQRSTRLTGLNPVYTVANSFYTSAFHDVTVGTNGTCGSVCTAGPGYDLVTGLGSPVGQNVISDLDSQP